MARIHLGALCLSATVAVVDSKNEQTDVGFELRVTNSKGPVARTCFDAVGMISTPPGSYYLAGPAKFDGLDEGDWKYKAIFDGLGMVNRFEIHPTDAPNKVCYTSVWMNTLLYQDYVKDHKKPPRGVLFEDTEPSRGACTLDMCDYMAPNDNNWVNMRVVGDEAVWFSDTPTMVTMDLKTLNCTGLKTFADDKVAMGRAQPDWVLGEHMAAGGSAHPLNLPGTDTLVEVMTEKPLMMGNNYVDVYTFDASVKGPQNRTKIARIEVDGPQYFHSFGVTPKHVVLPFNLKNTNLGPGHKPIIIGNFFENWHGIRVVDFSGGVQTFDDMEKFVHVHIANTFENDTGITMDLVAYDQIPFERMSVMDIKTSLNKTARDTSYPRGQVRRFHFDLASKTTLVQKLTDNNKDYDFVKINPSYNGLSYCFYYAVEWYHDDSSYASMAVMKHDICSGTKTFWNEPDVYMNEPFFIARAGGKDEDDGTVIFTANDGRKGKAIFVALDAKTLQEIQRIELPNHIPFTAHGQFVPTQSEVLIV